MNKDVIEIDARYIEHEQFVEKLLEMPDKYIWIDKLPQVGFTTSLGRVCRRKGLKFVEFAPKNRIIDVTVGQSIMDGERFGKVGSNKEMCPYSVSYKLFEGVYATSSCWKCPLYDGKNTYEKDGVIHECGYRRLVDEDFNVYGITYPKYEILTMRGDDEGGMDYFKREIEKKLLGADIILLDEFSRMVAYTPPGFYVDELDKTVRRLEIEQKGEANKAKADIMTKHLVALKKFNDDISKVKLDKTRRLKGWTHENDEIDVVYGILERDKKDVFKFRDADEMGYRSKDLIQEVKEYSKMIWGMKDTERFNAIIKNIVLCMSHCEVWMYEKEDRHKKDALGRYVKRTYAFAHTLHPFYTLKSKLKNENFKGKVFATGMVIPPFETLPFKKVRMEDFNKTEEKHLVVCDTKNMSFSKSERIVNSGKCIIDNWYREKEEIKNILIDVKKIFHPLRVIVFAFNKDVHDELEEWRKGMFEIVPEIKELVISDMFCFTHYRSEFDSGVNLSKYPIKFYVGLPETPSDVFREVALMTGNNAKDMRLAEIYDTAMNAFGRGKDPEGRRPSISYVIGADEDRVKEVYRFKEEKKMEIGEIYTQGTMREISVMLPNWWYPTDWFNDELKKLPEKMSFKVQPSALNSEIFMLLDMIKIVSRKPMTLINGILKVWTDKKNKPSTGEIRELIKKAVKCDWMPGHIKFDGRNTFKSSKIFESEGE